SSNDVDERYRKAAEDMGTALGRKGIRLIYGGGRVGLMGITADATLAAGGEVVGIIPEHIQSLEIQHTGLTELHVVEDMHTRKNMMAERSDGFVVLPGGLGTLDETFEILTWKQLRLHDKPVIIADIDGYWQSMMTMIDHIIDSGFAKPAHRDLYTVVDTIDQVIPALYAAPQPVIDPKLKWT
ncbi:MAG: TIGR00730 family Rossman fold protein, partial [Pseudomonadota bacterium]